MKKIKPWMLILAIIVLFFTASALYINIKFGKDINQLVINQINNYLSTELTTKDIKLSVLKRFPKITVVVKDAKLQAQPIENMSHKNLAEIKNLYIVMNLKGFFSQNYIVERLDIDKANVYIELDENKKANYDIFKASDSNEEKPFKIDLQKISLSNINFIYLDRSSAQRIYFSFDKIRLHGTLDQKQYNLELGIKAKVDSILNNNKLQIENYRLNTNSRLLMSSDFKNFELKNTKIDINDFLLDLSGKIALLEDVTALDIQVQPQEIVLQDIVSLLPDTVRKVYELYPVKGNLQTSIRVQGNYSKNQVPEINCSFAMDNGELRKKDSDFYVRKIEFKGSYSNKGSKDQSKHIVQVDDMKARLSNKLIHLNFKLNNFKDPIVQGRIDAEIKLDRLFQLIGSDKIANMEGLLKLNTNFITRINDLKNNKLSEANALKGTIAFEDVNIDFYNNELFYKDFNGNIEFIDKNMLIKNYEGYIGKSHISLQGEADNLFRYLSSKDEKLLIKARFKSEYLQLDELFKPDKKSEKVNSQVNVIIPKDVAFELDLSCDEAVYNKLKTENLRGRITLTQHGIVMDNLALKTARGLAKLNGRVFQENNDQISVDGIFLFENIDIKELFKQLDNFGQDVLLAENLEGNLNSRVKLNSVWNADLSPDLDKLFAIAEVTIDDGALDNFEPITKLLKFIKLKKIKNIKFDQLNNTFLIKDKQLDIPEMDIVSDAFALSVAGYHGFNNDVDYHFKVNLKDLYFKKHNQSKNDFESGDDDGKGGMNLLVRMTGNIDDPKIKYDGNVAKEQIKEGLEKEKKEFINLFKKDKQKSEEEEYELEWDEK